LHDKLANYLEQEEMEQFRNEFIDLHPYDQSVFFEEQVRANRLRIYSYLSPKEMADIMENVELEDAEKFITEMDPRFASMVIADMAVDDAVDIMQELSKDVIASFLAIMDKD